MVRITTLDTTEISITETLLVTSTIVKDPDLIQMIEEKVMIETEITIYRKTRMTKMSKTISLQNNKYRD